MISGSSFSVPTKVPFTIPLSKKHQIQLPKEQKPTKRLASEFHIQGPSLSPALAAKLPNMTVSPPPISSTEIRAVFPTSFPCSSSSKQDTLRCYACRTKQVPGLPFTEFITSDKNDKIHSLMEDIRCIKRYSSFSIQSEVEENEYEYSRDYTNSNENHLCFMCLEENLQAWPLDEKCCEEARVSDAPVWRLLLWFNKTFCVRAPAPSNRFFLISTAQDYEDVTNSFIAQTVENGKEPTLKDFCDSSSSTISETNVNQFYQEFQMQRPWNNGAETFLQDTDTKDTVEAAGACILEIMQQDRKKSSRPNETTRLGLETLIREIAFVNVWTGMLQSQKSLANASLTMRRRYERLLHPLRGIYPYYGSSAFESSINWRPRGEIIFHRKIVELGLSRAQNRIEDDSIPALLSSQDTESSGASYSMEIASPFSCAPPLLPESACNSVPALSASAAARATAELEKDRKSIKVHRDASLAMNVFKQFELISAGKAMRLAFGTETAPEEPNVLAYLFRYSLPGTAERGSIVSFTNGPRNTAASKRRKEAEKQQQEQAQSGSAAAAVNTGASSDTLVSAY